MIDWPCYCLCMHAGYYTFELSSLILHYIIFHNSIQLFMIHYNTFRCAKQEYESMVIASESKLLNNE